MDTTVDDIAMPRLVTFDVGGTLGELDGVTHYDRILAASPLPAPRIREIMHDELRIKTLPSPEALTEEMVEQVCRRLRISRDRFPYGVDTPVPYRLFRSAMHAVAAVAARVPVAVVVDMSVFADPALDPIRRALPSARLHVSWKSGTVKSDPTTWRSVAAAHKVRPQDLVHIGDSWKDDVVPVLAVGARAVWIDSFEAGAPDPEPAAAGRLLAARDVADAVDQALGRWVRP